MRSVNGSIQTILERQPIVRHFGETASRFVLEGGAACEQCDLRRRAFRPGGHLRGHGRFGARDSFLTGGRPSQGRCGLDFAGEDLDRLRILRPHGRGDFAGAKRRRPPRRRDLDRSRPTRATRLPSAGQSRRQCEDQAGRPATHLKAYAIDGALLRTCSANFSASGEREQDNDHIVIRGAGAAAVHAHFERMWDVAQPMIEFEPAIRALEPK